MKNNKKNDKSTDKKPRKPRTPTRSPLSYQRPGMENSYQSEEGISQLSNNTPDNFTTGTLTNIESLPLFKFHKQYLSLRNKIIRTFVFCFYGIEQFAFINYICYVIQQKFRTEIGALMATEKYKNHQYKVEQDMEQLLVIRRDDLISKFLEAEKNIQSIKQAKIVMDKQRDVNFIKINSNFFNMLSSICDDMLKKTSEQEKQLLEDQKVTCKGCGNKRDYYQIQAKVKCNCGSIQMVILKDNSEQKMSVKILNDQIQKILLWKFQMDDLKKKQVERVSQQRNKNFQSNRVTDVDKDIAKANQLIQKHGMDFVSPWSRFPIKKNGVQLKMAEEQFAPKREYRMIQELIEVRKNRKMEKVQKGLQYL